MASRRYRVRAFHHGEQLLPHHHTITALDLDTGHGVATAQIEADRLLRAIARAAGLRSRDLTDCHLRVDDEATGQTVCHFYPFADPL